MPSPFPGMNPYIENENIWSDFHGRLILQIADVLVAQVKGRYIVKTEEHIFIQEPEAGRRGVLGITDVGVVGSRSLVESDSATSVLEAPTQVELLSVETERQRYLGIWDRHFRQMVTAIELLSPSNKSPGDNREQYLAKRQQLIASPTHLVEIDLLRAGSRLPLRNMPTCDYYVLVSREQARPKAELWPFRLTDPLPKVPVPLRPSDPDAVLDLKPILDRLYDAAGYAFYIYEEDPRLKPDETAWARKFVPQA